MPFLAADRAGFDAVDDWRAFPAVTNVKSHVEAGYRAATHVDSRTAVSAQLAGRLRTDYGIVAATVPNGVDLDLYTSGAPPRPPGAPAGDFAVYIGVVQQRVDAELLRACAAVMPVLVVGPISEATAPALRHGNVTCIGAVPADTIPAWLRAASVGLVPHRVNDLTTSMDPMKLREYLAAGLPVVTTMAPSDDLRSSRVMVAASPADFADAVGRLRALPRLGAPDPEVIHRTWRTVAAELFAAHVAPDVPSGRTPG